MNWPLTRGNRTGKAASEMGPGEFVRSTGAGYLPGRSDRLWKLGGRATFGTVSADERVKGLVLAQYDDPDSDKLLAFAGDTIYKATPGITGTFAALITGLDEDATHLAAAHAFDRWYLANGIDTIRVLEDDDTTYAAGMQAPQEALIATKGAGATTTTRPTTASGFTNSANAYDADRDTYASGTRGTVGSVALVTSGWASNAASNRVLTVEWGLASEVREQNRPGIFGDLGGQSRPGWSATVKIEVSVDGGTTYTTYVNATYSFAQQRQMLQVPISANSNLVYVRATLTYNTPFASAVGANIVTMQVFDHRIDEGSGVANFSTSTEGVTYAVTEYDQTRGDESPWSSFTNVVLATQNRVDLTLPTAARNSRATHWRIYRTADGGVAPQELGLIAQLPIAATSFRDDFTTFGVTVQPTQPPPLLGIAAQDETIYFPLDNAPPVVSWLTFFKGSLVGLLGRALYYSVPGRPGSWPSIYVVDSFSLPEHDTLIRAEEVGGSLVVWAAGAVFRVDELPRVVEGLLNASAVEVLRGAPGLVGVYGVAAIPFGGEANVAWIAEDGIYVTNGHTYERITTDQDWAPFEGLNKSQWLLQWDAGRQLLVFAYSLAGGVNDRSWTGSLAREHMSEGQPKWTGPHYGSLSAMASGVVGNSRRLYSGHGSDGVVYLENYGGLDDSASYDGVIHPMIVQTGKVHNEYDEWTVMRGNLRHGDFGTGESGTLAWRAGRDGSRDPQSRSLTLSLASEQGTEFDVARSGDWHEWTFTHLGSGVSWLQDMRCEVLAAGRSGTVSAVGP